MRCGPPAGGVTAAGNRTPFRITTALRRGSLVCRTASSSTASELQTTAWASRSQARSHGTSSRCSVTAALRLRRELTTTGTPTLRAIGTPSRYDQYRKQCTTSGEASRMARRNRRISGKRVEQYRATAGRGSRSRRRGCPPRGPRGPVRPRCPGRSPSPRDPRATRSEPSIRTCRSVPPRFRLPTTKAMRSGPSGRVARRPCGRGGHGGAAPAGADPKAAEPSPATRPPPGAGR